MWPHTPMTLGPIRINFLWGRNVGTAVHADPFVNVDMIVEPHTSSVEGEDEISQVIDQLLAPSPSSPESPLYKDEPSKPTPLMMSQDQIGLPVYDPICGILTGEADQLTYGRNHLMSPQPWPPSWGYPEVPWDPHFFDSPGRTVAANLAFLATKIVGSSLPKDTQDQLITAPPSSPAEAKSLLCLLQSQPRRRGRPRKNPLPQPNQLKRPRGRPRKRPIEETSHRILKPKHPLLFDDDTTSGSVPHSIEDMRAFDQTPPNVRDECPNKWMV
eukprot:Blabericola_migrator_1__367@NODE_1092_length_5463_cov_333_784470_g747_i0_p2_GENE_NODE_1092_length_5463_cov_333_784470_g747_i0NODE_1092_length_5463_cov_333_784470_g747_i0_p2_ORF_typecomplete_len271_score48_75AT_hook/PF02178_19/0_68AT_hook/PF02178_19/62_NODE_1092_length_5463_cov_333_784470_g747_i029773789